MQRPVVNDLRVILLRLPQLAVQVELGALRGDADGVVVPSVVTHLGYGPPPLRRLEHVPLVLPVVAAEEQHELAVPDEERGMVPALPVVICHAQDLLLAVLVRRPRLESG